MEEKQQSLHRQIVVTRATITWTDGISFHASATLLKKLSERMSKERTLLCPKEGEDYNISIAWVET
jgi:hypothetical protein